MDPLVSLMMVEKVPDSTYEMVGGLDKQIKEIKEVCPFSCSVVSFQVSCCVWNCIQCTNKLFHAHSVILVAEWRSHGITAVFN